MTCVQQKRKRKKGDRDPQYRQTENTRGEESRARPGSRCWAVQFIFALSTININSTINISVLLTVVVVLLLLLYYYYY